MDDAERRWTVKEARLRELCDEHMVDAEGGGRTDASELWPSQVLAILDDD